MKEDAPFVFGFIVVAVAFGMLLGFYIGQVRVAQETPAWIDKQARLISWEGKPYRMIECEYTEKKEVKP